MNRVIRLYIVKWRLTMQLMLMRAIVKAAEARSMQQSC
jgi:hypothetical protein